MRNKGAARLRQKCLLLVRRLDSQAAMIKWFHALTAFALALFVASPLSAQSDETPPGWTKKTAENGLIGYFAPGDKGLITVRSVPMPPEDSLQLGAIQYYGEMMGKQCGFPEGTMPTLMLEDRVARIQVVLPNYTCTFFTAKQGQYMLLVMALGETASSVDQMALDIVAKRIGAAPAMPPKAVGKAPITPVAPVKTAVAPAKNISPPAIKSQSGTVQSKGTQGIFTALFGRNVYDATMGVRWEFGVSYLVLTKGGLFLTDLPDEGGFDDASVQKHIVKNPDDGGSFTISGKQMSLRFASGKTAIITIKGDDFIYDGETYSSELYFADGATLSGPYTSTSVTNYGPGGFVVGNNDYDFTPDGRFGHGRQVNIANTGFTIKGGKEGRGGTYRIANSALHLTYDDGEQRVLSLWAEKPDDAIWFDGEMFKRPWDK
jgi:hypothetical protein